MTSVLLDGVDWETPSHELAAGVPKPLKPKSMHRLGQRAARKIKLEEPGGDPPGANAATQYRAPAARCNYLALDRHGVGIAAKEWVRRVQIRWPNWVGPLTRQRQPRTAVRMR